MTEPTITFILNDKTYRLSADNPAAVGDIPGTDRQHLITLLEAIKRQDELGKAAVQQAVDKAKGYVQSNASSSNYASEQTPKPERLGSGDVDALMARLILEDKHNHKPGITKQTIYKVFGGLAAAIILLLLIF